MAVFTLVTVHRVNAGRVSGSWLQECIGTLEEATARATRTSSLNHDLPIAVIESPGYGGIGTSIFEHKILVMTGKLAERHEAGVPRAQ